MPGQIAHDMHSLCPGSCEVGCGFAAFRYVFGDVEVERVLSLMPSLHCGERRPILFVTLNVKNKGRAAVRLEWEEAIGARYDFTALNNPGAVNKRRVDYPASCSLDDRVLTTRFTPVADMPLVLSDGMEMAWQESHPPRVCLAALEQEGRLAWSQESTDLIWMSHSIFTRSSRMSSTRRFLHVAKVDSTPPWPLSSWQDLPTPWRRWLPVRSWPRAAAGSRRSPGRPERIVPNFWTR